MAREILIVDDEADIRMLITGILDDEGFETREASNSTETLDEIRKRRPDLVILDVWLQNSELDGIEVLTKLKRTDPSLPVVIISGHGTIGTAVQAIKLGAYDFIEKPFKSDRLLLVVERALEAAELRSENEELRLRVGPDHELIGASAPVNQLRQAIEKVAPTGSRVLITGPAGAGKEVVARLLHHSSARAGEAFVALNCAGHARRIAWRPSSSARRPEGRAAIPRASSGPSSGPIAALCSWTRSPTCRWKPRARSLQGAPGPFALPVRVRRYHLRRSRMCVCITS